MEIFKTIVTSGVIGTLFLFVEFLIRRDDEKKDKSGAILARFDDMDARFNLLNSRIVSIEEKAAEREAVAMRVRILRFMDELREDRKHSKDSFDQCMSDITDYEHYCATHPGFKNNQTELTIRHINRIYEERLEKNDFLG